MTGKMRPVATAFVAAAVVFTAATAFFAFSPERSGTLLFWVLAGGPAVLLATIAVVVGQREDFLREWLSPRWGDFTRGLLGAVALFVAGWAFVRLVCPVGSPREIWIVSLYGQIGDPRTLHAHGALVAGTIAVVTVAEEIVWRGMVTQRLAEAVGSRMAWVWAAGLYALACAPTAWALRSATGLDPLLLIAALGGGLLWGAMARAFGSLVPGILAHALFDWAVVMMFPLWGGHLWG